MTSKSRAGGLALFAVFTLNFAALATAAQPSYTLSVFTKGSDVSASNPMGLTYDGTDIWVSYANGATTNGASGSSTIVQYDIKGNILHTYVIPGYVEGLRWDATSGVIWAMQNPGGDPTVTTIKPGSGIVAGAPISFAVEAPSRGYANVDFSGTKIYLSYAAPVNPTDPTIQQILSPQAPLTVATILEMNATGTNIASGATGQPTLQNDPHCLRGTPNADEIVMSSAKDGQLIYVSNIGLTTQSVSFLNVVNAVGANVVGVNDVIYNNSTSGTFFVADVGANEIVAITATGLTKTRCTARSEALRRLRRSIPLMARCCRSSPT